MIAIYYGAPYDIPEEITGPVYYEAKLRDNICAKVIENTEIHSIRFVGFSERVNSNISEVSSHYEVMEKLSEILPEGITMILPGIETLANEPEEATFLLGKYIDHKISLEFTADPWLNFNNFHMMLKKDSEETKQSLGNAIKVTLLKRSMAVKEPLISTFQADWGIKKNDI